MAFSIKIEYCRGEGNGNNGYTESYEKPFQSLSDLITRYNETKTPVNESSAVTHGVS
jgi:hypothetical protein